VEAQLPGGIFGRVGWGCDLLELTSLAECCRCGRSRSKIETPCTAIVKVTNLAARLCGEAKGGQILISAGVATACLPR
jgi:hypothetical protein